MKRFDGILICTDLDGTLLGSDRRVSEENLAAIRRFEAAGGLFTFVTGRPPYCATDIYNTVRPNAPFGCFNGGGIYDAEAGKYVYTRELARDALELVRVAMDAIPEMGVQLNTFEKIWFCRDNTAMEWFREITGVPRLTAELGDVREPLAKIVFADFDVSHIDELSRVLNAHSRANAFDFVRSEKTLYEILPKGINKGALLPQLADHLGVSRARVIALGDYNNDVEMLREAGLGIAVANAVPEAKAAADRVTVSNDEHAIAQVIKELENGEIEL